MKEWMLGLGAVALSAVVWNASSLHRQAPLVGASSLNDQVSSLEASVAAHPDDAHVLANLCRAYLDRGAPGFALSAIHHATPAVRRSPDVQHLWAEALLRAGHAGEAWKKERLVDEYCRRATCPQWLRGSVQFRKPFLDRLHEQGVGDYRRAPEKTVQAFDSVPVKWLRVSSQQP